MESQLLAETGNLLQISLLDSSEKEILEILNFAKEKEPKLKKLDSIKVAKTIVQLERLLGRILKLYLN
ncbi:hypothetical protein AWQ21_07795 [Picosynechococcus sp. PCC 7003]|uniref:hypothetical protein n=1 Tax=Picosynechococcus sp. PCC 7003 TaxID=374981 RepID=UPI000810BEBA|nr:hypothetical protein [Picosynechococcus sp. PCC 7003]ANV84294.1 hypothetical protein AWQ21_07795 [Picosynechococcus sp. PCC 7003]